MGQALGKAVFAGMPGATLFGLFLTPVFYVMMKRSEPAGPRFSLVELTKRRGAS